MLKRNKVLISGKVQGVFFRRFIFDHALRLELKGYVKNTPDAKVEAVFQGESDKVKKMLEFCKLGPPHSKITDVVIYEEEPQNEVEFKILD